MEPVLLSWSGGKDCALALSEIQGAGRRHAAALLTTVNEEYQRICMHGVRLELLRQQAAALGLPLEEIYLSSQSSNAEYETKMDQTLRKYQAVGVNEIVFGDIFLEDVRKYREANLAKLGMAGCYPLWGRDTRGLARSFIGAGFKAVVTCVDTQALDGRFAGRLVDEELLADLPATVDPCGENGEFHTFVYGGPIFTHPIRLSLGERVLRDNRFFYCDLLPEGR